MKDYLYRIFSFSGDSFSGDNLKFIYLQCDLRRQSPGSDISLFASVACE